MKIEFKRDLFGKDSTGGICFVNGEKFGYSCEDETREVKVMHETCIPPGKYELRIRDAGGMNERYKKKYGFHKGMLHLLNVPGFEWIYIHVGNTDDDTSGCILIGKSRFTQNGETVVHESVAAYEELYGLIQLALEWGEEIWVEVS